MSPSSKIDLFIPFAVIDQFLLSSLDVSSYNQSQSDESETLFVFVDDLSPLCRVTTYPYD